MAWKLKQVYWGLLLAVTQQHGDLGMLGKSACLLVVACRSLPCFVRVQTWFRRQACPLALRHAPQFQAISSGNCFTASFTKAERVLAVRSNWIWVSNKDKADPQGLGYAAFLKGDLCLLLFYVCVSVCKCHMGGGLCRGQKRVSGLLELELQVLVMWVLWPKLRSSGRAGNSLNHEAMTPASAILF